MSGAPGKWPAITLLCLAQVAAMSLWFSATAAVPSLAAAYALSGWQQSLITSAVQVGFVVGSLASAVYGLADRLDPKRFFIAASLIAAAANAVILAAEPGAGVVVLARFVTGVAMAGIYPIGMKIAATWADRDMGLMVGLLVGALTLGSASPHLFNAAGGVDWRLTVAAASAAAILSALLMTLVRLGPNRAAAPGFDPHAVLLAWRSAPLRLAILGYLGHMWELYAMWAWIGVFLAASFTVALAGAAPASAAPALAAYASFAVIAIGAAGCLVGGVVADRWGRTTLTIAAMAVSGGCAVIAGLLFGTSPWLLTGLCLVWGVAVIADSAQFSAAVAELSPSAAVGTMLTVQTALGFLLTLVTIHLMPVWVDSFGWRYAFAPLAIGPALGIVAMARLRRHPEALRLAGGRR